MRFQDMRSEEHGGERRIEQKHVREVLDRSMASVLTEIDGTATMVAMKGSGDVCDS